MSTPAIVARVDALSVIDSAVERRVLVYGSLPPEGRDIDLVVPDDEVPRLSAALESAGFQRLGNEWAWFGECTAVGVDVVPVSMWRLTSADADALFDESLPLEGRSHVGRPSPSHALLILARRLAAAHGPLPDKHRRKIEAALAEDPRAWERARARAWGDEPALDRLRRAEATGSFPFRVPRPHRPGLVVSLSGLDGAGKSSQAAALVEALARLGRPATAVWTPLGNNPVQRKVAAAAKRVLRRGAARQGAAAPSLSRGRGSEGSDGSVAAALWSSFGGLVNGGWHLWTAAPGVVRGDVVVFDRYILDSLVHLHFAYGPRAVPQALVRSLSLRPARAYLLDVRPETALARKDDLWTLDELTRQAELYRHYAAQLGIRVLDGERPRDELCAEIAADVWRSLHRRA